MALIEWEILLVADLFLSGLGAGAYLTAVVADIRGGEEYKKLSRFGFHLSWPLALMGLALLVLHLGRPELTSLTHILNVFNNFSSMMTIGSLLVGSFIAVGALTSFLWLAGSERSWLKTIIEVIGSIIAAGVVFYPGLVLAVSRGIPFWISPFLPWVFGISAVLTGLALVGLAETHLGALLFPRFSAKPEVTALNTMTGAASSMIIAQLVTLVCYMANAVIVGATMGISHLVTGSLSLIFWSMLIIGLILPLLIRYSISRRVMKPGTETGIMLLALVSFICIIAGGFFLRYVILFAGQL